jgi:PAS domain-containing protein
VAAQPLELILARNLVAGLTLAGLLCNIDGTIVFLNQAAGELLGRRFEELEHLTLEQWEHEFGEPEASAGSGIEVGQLVTRAAQSGAPARQPARLRVLDGQLIDAEVSAIPLSTVDGFRGAIVLIAAAHASEG